jgi:DNA (cytosine-5)-methyltransferase 1
VKFVSLFSGIEAASVAWTPLGWRAQAFAEIDPFCSALLASRYPDVPNHGNMTKFDWSEYRGTDLVVGGSPCQAFSLAGLRKGLDDPRGNLALAYLAAVAKIRPRWMVWENVPGVLSVDRGRTFGTFLGALGELGYGFAYRILDAQYVRTRRFGRAVAQRRRRVFVVGYLGDWRPPAAVLFDAESLRGNSPPGREARQAEQPAAAPAGCVTFNSEVSGTLTANHGNIRAGDAWSGLYVSHTLNAHAHRSDAESETFVPMVSHTLKGAGFDASEDGTGRGTPIIGFSCKDNGNDACADVAPTLRSMGHNTSHANGGGHAAVAIAQNQRGELRTSDVMGALALAGGKPGQGNPVVAVALRGRDGGSDIEIGGNVSNALRASQGGSDKVMCFDQIMVRRLTPLECERLQGFPDRWTEITYRGKRAADSPRYKAIGNSIAINCLEGIGERLAFVDAVVSVSSDTRQVA